MRDQHINSFNKGMMKDLGATIPQEGSYIDAENIRIISDGSSDGSSGVAINVKGNEKKIDFINIGDDILSLIPTIYHSWVETGSLTPDNLTTVNFGNTLLWETGTYLYVQGNMYFNNSGETQSLGLVSLPGGGSVLSSMYMDGIVNDYSPSDPEESLIALGPIDVPTYEMLINASEIEYVKILGYTTIRNTLVLFFNMKFVASNEVIGAISTVDLTEPTLSINIIYQSNDLNFNSEYPIEAVGRYESEDIQRIYWTDNLNPVRTLNIVNTVETNLSVNELSLAPSVAFSRPEVVDVELSGNLLGGMYQYGYRLKTNEGVETKVSPLTNLIHVVNGTKNAYWHYTSDPEDTTEYSEAPVNEETNKSVSLKFTELDSNYDTVELIAVYKTSAQGVNSAYIVEQKRIPISGEVFITHKSLDNLIPITIEEVTAFNETPDRVKTIATKDNRLFLGNCSSIANDLLFNARAYRYKRNDGSSDHPFLALGNNEWSSNVGEVEDYETYVDEDFDPLAPGGDIDNLNAINPFNLVSSAYEQKYKYHKDGITLGGEGPNISYKFIKKKINGNTAAGATIPGELVSGAGSNVYPVQTYDYVAIPPSPPFVSGSFSTLSGNCEQPTDSSLGDYKDPIIAEKFKGYHREELYRFGIVLYDLQGNPGFVNWIGDIKFPTYSDYDHEKGAGICNFTLSQIQNSSGGNYIHAEYNGGYTLNDATIDVNNNFSGMSAEEMEELYGAEFLSFIDFTKGSSHTDLFALGLEFTVNIPDELKPLVSGYSIVRCKREQRDKTVLGMGPVTFLHAQETGATDDPRYVLPIRNAYHQDGNYNNFYGESVGNIFTIDSPDFAFTKNYPSRTECSYISIVGGFNGVRQEEFNGSSKFDAQVGGIHTMQSINNGGGENPIAFSSIFSRGAQIYPSNVQSIISYVGEEDFKGIQNRSLYGSVGSNQYQSDTLATSAIGEESLLVITENDIYWPNYFDSGINETLPTVGAWNETSVNQKGKIIAAVKEPPSEFQYGGNTFEARRSNSYMSTGHYADKNTTVSEVWGGDTYVTIYDLEKLKKHNGSNDPYTTVSDENKRRSVSIAYPVETTINTTLRSGYHFANKTDWDIDGEQQYNEFELNSVYSAEAITSVFIPKPLNFSEVLEFDHKILYSNVKIDGSVVDGWRQFKLENYKDVEGDYGGITKLIVHQDNMFFLQERGFGGLSISPVSTVVDNDGTSIVLGTGDVIQNFKYISTTVGSQDQRSIINTTKGIYWVDKKTKKIHAFRANGLDSVSDTHGMKSWSFDNIKHDSVLVTGNDVINDEVLFSIDGITLVFSEHINKFTSFYTYGTPLYINTFDRLFSIDPSSSEIYEHNISDAYNWFGEGYESSIEFIVNKHPLNVKVFDNIEWYTETDHPPYNINQFESGTFSNSNAGDSTEDDLSEAVVKERMTKMPVPRVNDNYRFRDTYMKVKLVSSNASKFVLHYVKTWFRISHR